MMNEEDRRTRKSVTEQLAHLCLSDELADVEFCFPQNIKLPAHKFLLSMRSEVFNTMFNGLMSKGEKEVVINDCSPELFRTFLKYLYTDIVELNSRSASVFLYLAEKYCIVRLVDECSHFLKTSIRKENVCTIYEQATMYNLQELQANCLTYMLDHARQVFLSTDFLGISGKTLKLFLGHDSLSCEEIDVFKAALNWAKYQCELQQTEDNTTNVRKYLAETFYETRYPLISTEFLAKVIGPTGLLTNDEQLLLFKYSAVGNTGDVLKDSEMKFKTEPRHGNLIEVMLEKKQQKKYHPVNTGTISLTLETQGMVTISSVRGNVLNNAGSVHIKWFKNPEEPSGHGNKEHKMELESWKVQDGEVEFDKKVIVDNGSCQIDINLLPNHLLSNIGNFNQTNVVDDNTVNITYSNYQSGFLESMVFAR